MEKQQNSSISKELLVYFAILGIFAFASGMSDNVISNFFNDAYNVTPVQRGFLEFPREAPGVLCFLIIAFTSKLGDVRLALFAQLLCVVGALVLGLITPPFGIMALFIFIHSLGAHLFFPLQDSIGMSIIGEHEIGKRMGQFGSVRSGATMLASILIFIGFRAGYFSFKTDVKMPFLIGVVGYFAVFILFIVLYAKYKVKGGERKQKFQIIFKKQYTLYYILAVLTGVHRQIMMVFGPWVLITILNREAGTMALLGIIASLIGVFLLPIIGRWIDRFGTKKILLTEGAAFIIVYAIFGLMSYWFTQGTLATIGIPVIIIFCLFVFDRLTMQLGIVRAAYLRSIITDPADLTPTLSTGFSMDHVVSITCAYLGGVVWHQFGSQYVFYGAAVLSILNVVVAILIKQPPQKISETTVG